MPKVCLTCGGKSHTYVDDLPVCDNCGKGSRVKHNISYNCIHHYHHTCTGKCRSSAVSEKVVDYSSRNSYSIIKCECSCHEVV